MAGSIINNTINKYKYVAPTSPSSLIDCSTYTRDFAACKFINIGLDSTDHFNAVIHIIILSRHVSISMKFLRRIFSLMGNILSFILDKPVKYKWITFLETDSYRTSSMVY
jgi:hypothetical protein